MDKASYPIVGGGSSLPVYVAPLPKWLKPKRLKMSKQSKEEVDTKKMTVILDGQVPLSGMGQAVLVVSKKMIKAMKKNARRIYAEVV